MSETSLPLITRLWFSLVCLLRVLFDGAFAARAWAVRSGPAQLPAAKQPKPARKAAEQVDEPAPKRKSDRPAPDKKASPKSGELDESLAKRAAPLQLLALLQREGRLIDFLQQDITDFDDQEVGAASRVVHEGCRKALETHAKIEPVRRETEESRIEVKEGYDPAEIKLTGNVTGKPPYKGVLRHRGWRVVKLKLPTALKGHDFEVVAPAEDEL